MKSRLGFSSPVIPFLVFLVAAFGPAQTPVSWSPIGLSSVSVSSVATSPAAPSTVYAITTTGFQKTENGGASWAPVLFGIHVPLPVTAVAIDPDSPSTVYAGTGGDGINFPPAAPGTIYKTIDGGMNWSFLPGFVGVRVNALVAVSRPARRVFAATPQGIFSSPDGGATWVLVGASGTEVLSLAFSPGETSLAYAGAGDGVYRSLDAGQSWVRIPVGAPNVFTGVVSLAIDPNHSSVVYAAANFFGCPFCGAPPEPGLLRTTDGWVTSSPVLIPPENPNRAGFAVGPDSTVYAGTPLGAFQSSDHGATWIPASGGLTTADVHSITVAGETLYAATGSGVFRSGNASACVPGPTALCLSTGRFRIEVAWTAASIDSNGAGQSISLTPDTGAFWFFQPSNLELVIKVLDGRAVNGHFWVFYGALTNVGYTITVADTVTGAIRTYTSAEGQLASQADTEAF